MALIEQGWWVRGLRTGRGVVVVEAERVAFVPTERPKHLGVEFAWGAAGFVEVGARKIQPDQLIASLRAAPVLADRAGELAASLGGLVWTTAAAAVHEHKIPLRRRKRGLWFVAGDQSLRLSRAIAVTELAELAPLLAAWPRR